MDLGAADKHLAVFLPHRVIETERRRRVAEAHNHAVVVVASPLPIAWARRILEAKLTAAMPPGRWRSRQTRGGDTKLIHPAVFAHRCGVKLEPLPVSACALATTVAQPLALLRQEIFVVSLDYFFSPFAFLMLFPAIPAARYIPTPASDKQPLEAQAHCDPYRMRYPVPAHRLTLIPEHTAQDFP